MVIGRDFGAYRPGARDVVVATYPKSGTNWTMQIAHQLATRGRGEFDHIHDVVPWPDFEMQEYLASVDDPLPEGASLRVIKTHLPDERIPYVSKARYLFVLRDPKDTFVSMVHFVRGTLLGPLMPSLEVFRRLVFSASSPLPWAEQVAGYWARRHLPNVLVLRYEEMRADPEAAVHQVAAFLGVDLTPEELAAVVERSSFAWMKAHDSRFAPPPLSPFATGPEMVRRGVAGGSAELLSPEQQRAIDAYCRDALRDLGSDLPYDEFWGGA